VNLFFCQAAGTTKNPSISAEFGTQTDARFMAEPCHRDLEL
jgi:hypothetical protein